MNTTNNTNKITLNSVLKEQAKTITSISYCVGDLLSLSLQIMQKDYKIGNNISDIRFNEGLTHDSLCDYIQTNTDSIYLLQGALCEISDGLLIQSDLKKVSANAPAPNDYTYTIDGLLNMQDEALNYLEGIIEELKYKLKPLTSPSDTDACPDACNSGDLCAKPDRYTTKVESNRLRIVRLHGVLAQIVGQLELEVPKKDENKNNK